MNADNECAEQQSKKKHTHKLRKEKKTNSSNKNETLHNLSLDFTIFASI